MSTPPTKTKKKEKEKEKDQGLEDLLKGYIPPDLEDLASELEEGPVQDQTERPVTKPESKLKSEAKPKQSSVRPPKPLSFKKIIESNPPAPRPEPVIKSKATVKSKKKTIDIFSYYKN